MALVACGDPDPGPPGAAEPGASVVAEGIQNVVLITLDTTRADALGVYGQSRPTTPNIDRIASQGVRFEHAVSAAPTTLPSHASILTGKYPYAHGARSNSGYVLSAENTTLAEVLQAAGYRTAAEIAAPVIGRHTLIDQGFERFRDPLSDDSRGTLLQVRRGDETEQVRLNERMATEITERGIEFLRMASRDPFFLWLHYFDVHAFHTPLPEFRERIPDSPYHAELRFVDDQVERIFAQLEGLGLRDRTLVVLTADHGEGLGDHGEQTHSYFLYDATIRVPLIFWGPPQLASGNVVDTLARTIDIAPTVLDLLGLPPLEGAQGRSLRALLEGGTDAGQTDPVAYGETIDVMPFGGAPIRYLRKGRWKYLHKVAPELYDVEADPGELVDLAAEHPEVVAELRSEIEAMLVAAPVKPVGSEVALDAAMRDQLEALGYMAAEAPAELDDELATLTLSGPDPRDMLDDFEALSKATGARKRGNHERAALGFRELFARYRKEFLGLDLARSLVLLGRFDEAAPVLEELIALAPDNPDYRVRLAEVLIKSGRVEDGEPMLRGVLESDPCNADARALLAHLAFSRGLYGRQVAMLRTGVDECPPSQKLLNNLAWALSTSPVEGQRDGARAVRYAIRLTESDDEPNPSHLDTLAAAYAEAGQFGAAIASARRAIAAESRKEDPQLLGSLQEHLEAFRAERPLRDPAAAPTPGEA